MQRLWLMDDKVTKSAFLGFLVVVYDCVNALLLLTNMFFWTWRWYLRNISSHGQHYIYINNKHGLITRKFYKIYTILPIHFFQTLKSHNNQSLEYCVFLIQHYFNPLKLSEYSLSSHAGNIIYMTFVSSFDDKTKSFYIN